MPWFHAMFSALTVVGALVGSLFTWLRVPVVAHLAGIGVLGILAVFLGLRALDERQAAVVPDTSAPVLPGRPAWLEPKTLAIGFVVFVAAFTVGTANDWVAVALVEGYHLPPWAGVLGFATFLGFMTIGRVLGAGILDRYGRVPVIRVFFVLAVVGSLLVVFGGGVLAFLGAAVWGVGASLGFPTGMSAAADDPARAAARLSVVSTIGYLAFLGGPPVLGFIGDHVGVLRSLLLVGVLAVPAIFVAGSLRERR